MTDTSPSLVAKGVLRSADMAEFGMSRRRTIFRWVEGALGFGLILLTIPLWEYSTDFGETAWQLLPVYPLALLLIFWAFCQTFWRRWLFRKSPGMTRERSYTITRDGLHLDSEDATGDYRWSLFQKIDEGRDTFFLYTTISNAICIPKRFFAAHGDIRTFRELASANYKGKLNLRRE